MQSFWVRRYGTNVARDSLNELGHSLIVLVLMEKESNRDYK